MGAAHLLILLLVSCLTATLLGEANVINKRTTEGEEELIHGIEKRSIWSEHEYERASAHKDFDDELLRRVSDELWLSEIGLSRQPRQDEDAEDVARENLKSSSARVPPINTFIQDETKTLLDEDEARQRNNLPPVNTWVQPPQTQDQNGRDKRTINNVQQAATTVVEDQVASDDFLFQDPRETPAHDDHAVRSDSLRRDSVHQNNDKVAVAAIVMDEDEDDDTHAKEVSEAEQHFLETSADSTKREPTKKQLTNNKTTARPSVKINGHAYQVHHPDQSNKKLEHKEEQPDKFWFWAVMGAIGVAGIAGIAFAVVCYQNTRRSPKEDTNPAVFDNKKQQLPSQPPYQHSAPKLSGDEQLVHDAEVFHFGHTKQELTRVMGKNNKQGRLPSEDTDDDGVDDRTVYECPGLAPHGDMKVMNPLFSESHSSNESQHSGSNRGGASVSMTSEPSHLPEGQRKDTYPGQDVDSNASASSHGATDSGLPLVTQDSMNNNNFEDELRGEREPSKVRVHHHSAQHAARVEGVDEEAEFDANSIGSGESMVSR